MTVSISSAPSARISNALGADMMLKMPAKSKLARVKHPGGSRAWHVRSREGHVVDEFEAKHTNGEGQEESEGTRTV